MAKVHIPLSSIKAAIFDMDGTMINNATYHKRAWQDYLKQHGIVLTDDAFHHTISGKSNDQILASVFTRKLGLREIAQYGDEKEALYRKLYKHDIQEVAGLLALIELLHQQKLPAAIATTANAKNRAFALKALTLEDAFTVIVGEEHVRHGKPDPEIYLQAAHQLQVEPKYCLVFEDSPPGVKAGKAAGMTVVGVLTSHSRESLAEVDYLIRDFTQVAFI